MQSEDLAKLLHARKCGKSRWRAVCPVHKGRSLTLAVYSDAERVSVHCFAGCSSDDVLAAVGLTWKDCLYDSRPLTPKERQEWAKRKWINELYCRQVRIFDLEMMLHAIEHPRKTRTVSARVIQFENRINQMCNELEARC